VLVYLKRTGAILKHQYGRLLDQLPKGEHKLIVRSLVREVSRRTPFDGGEVEVVVTVKKQGHRPWVTDQNIKYPDLHFGGVKWGVSCHGNYTTWALKYRLHVFESSQEEAYHASYIGTSCEIPIGPMAEVLPTALFWARGIVTELNEHAIEESKSWGKPPALGRFKLIESTLEGP
jgi:hypothetical protein